MSTEFGFRTFATDKGRFLLNGKPYWLRGADHFPAPLFPNDAGLARKFIELAREGNVRITRSSCCADDGDVAESRRRTGAGRFL